MNIALVIVDPQNDFCKPGGALYVPGAEKDCDRIAGVIAKSGRKFKRIFCSMDMHHAYHISHPRYIVDQNGNHPKEFTEITVDDVKAKKWKASDPGEQDWFEYYVSQLAVDSSDHRKRYVHRIWPEHCLIGSEGANIYPSVYKALYGWEKQKVSGFVDFVSKGSNYRVEHFSIVEANVPDPKDPTTLPNMPFINLLSTMDLIYICGEAITHCVAETARDIAKNFGEDNIKKLVLLEDCSSPVAGCEILSDEFLHEMTGKGMLVTTSDRMVI